MYILGPKKFVGISVPKYPLGFRVQGLGYVGIWTLWEKTFRQFLLLRRETCTAPTEGASSLQLALRGFGFRICVFRRSIENDGDRKGYIELEYWTLKWTSIRKIEWTLEQIQGPGLAYSLSVCPLGCSAGA